MAGPVYHFLRQADVVFSIGSSLTKHGMATNIPAGKTLIHATNDERDLNKNYAADYPILGHAKLVLRQFIDAIKDLGPERRVNGDSAAEVLEAKEAWLREWRPKLTSSEVPITPYRIIWEFMQTVSPSEAITLFLTQVRLTKGLPFPVRTPNRQTRRAIKETRSRRNVETFPSASAWAKKMRSL